MTDKPKRRRFTVEYKTLAAREGRCLLPPARRGRSLLTPESVHYGRAATIVEGRRQVLLDFFGAHPERFVKATPKPPEIPSAAWINPPTTKTTHQIGAQAVSEASDDLQVPLICNIYGEPVVSDSAASVTRTQHNHAQTRGNPA